MRSMGQRWYIGRWAPRSSLYSTCHMVQLSMVLARQVGLAPTPFIAHSHPATAMVALLARMCKQ